MIITEEKSLGLTAREIATICDFAIQNADARGFVNSFVYERALWVYMADIIYKERQEEINKCITEEGILAAWDMLLKDGTVEQMQEDYPVEIQTVSETGQIWFEEYEECQYSTRGLMDMLELFSTKQMKEALENFADAASTPLLQETVQIAEDWGMRN